MAGYEYEAQEVVANVIVDRGFEIRHRHLLLGLDLAAEFSCLRSSRLFRRRNRLRDASR